jgi:hypothetical protein
VHGAGEREGTPTHVRHLPSGVLVERGSATPPARGATTGATSPAGDKLTPLHSFFFFAAVEEKLKISDATVRQLREVGVSAPSAAPAGQTVTLLRVAVDAGGCSGFQYAFTFASASEVRPAAGERKERG